MSQGPDRRTVLLGGLGLIAGCTPAPLPPPPPAAPASAGPSASPVPSPSPTPAPAPAFRAMTYNILSGARPLSAFPRLTAGQLAFGNRVPVLAQWILSARPDVLGLQENEPMREPVHRPLGGLLPLLPGYDAVFADTNIPILYRPAAFQLLDSGIRVISRRRKDRYGAWVRLVHRRTGRTVLAANTHLLSGSSEGSRRTRLQSLQVLTDWLAEVNRRPAAPVVLLGDFNTGNDYGEDGTITALRPLYRAGLRNSVEVAERDASEVSGATSLNGFGTAVNGRWTYGAIRHDGRMIDYIFVDRSIEVRSWQVVTGPRIRQVDGADYFGPGVVPSDHCPVLVEVSFA